MTKSRITLGMTLAISIIAAYSAWMGLFSVPVYGETHAAGTMSRLLVVGSMAQDVISLPLSFLLAFLTLLCWLRPTLKKLIAILGISAYFLYAYGLYVIQGQYTSIYLGYLAIFGLSIYSLVFGLTCLNPRLVEQCRLPGWLSKTIAGLLMAILLLLTPIWLIRMGPDLAANVPGEVYGVFVLDLAIVFPAFAITAIYLVRKVPFGNILGGIALLKTFTLCLSVFIGESWKPFHRFEADLGMISVFGSLTALSGVLGVVYLRKLEYPREIPMETIGS